MFVKYNGTVKLIMFLLLMKAKRNYDTEFNGDVFSSRNS